MKLNSKLYLLTGIFVLVNLIQSVLTPISVDEAYYWVWSQHLDWGYFDHPPMTALWDALGYSIFGGTIGIRFVAVLMNGFALILLWKILKPKTIRQFWLFVILSGSTVVFQIFGFISTPDSPLLFFSLLYLFAFKKFLQKDSVFNLIFLAVSMAGLMYSKYHGLLLILFTMLPIIGRLIRNPKFFLVVLISLILYLPHLIWIYNHDFVPVHYHFQDRSGDKQFKPERLLNYPLVFFLGMSPLISWFSIKSLFGFKPKDDFGKSLKWLVVLTGIFFLFTLYKENVQPQWLLITFVAMMIICYEYYSENEFSNWLFKLGFAGIFLILIVRIGLILPSTSPFSINLNFADELKSRNIDHALFEKYQEASVFLFYNPDKKASVHRTLGNRENQFTLWDWEDEFYGQTVNYISPWIRSEDSIKAYKDKEYYIKEIPDYITFYKLKIQAENQFESAAGDSIRLKINLSNGHRHPLIIGGDSELRLNISYYSRKQYDVVYSTEIKIEKLRLKPGEEKEMEVGFGNISEVGNFKAAFGIHYMKIGTTYVSDPIEIISK